MAVLRRCGPLRPFLVPPPHKLGMCAPLCTLFRCEPACLPACLPLHPQHTLATPPMAASVRAMTGPRSLPAPVPAPPATTGVAGLAAPPGLANPQRGPGGRPRLHAQVRLQQVGGRPPHGGVCGRPAAVNGCLLGLFFGTGRCSLRACEATAWAQGNQSCRAAS